MAKPRIFISSTFYDLRQIRLELDKFIEGLGYEAVRNEEGDIPYGKEESLQDYCYKEISNVDILIAIIGGRFGSESNSNKDYSVSQKELLTALESKKHVFIFIEKNVASEFETYQLNKNNPDVKYRYIDNLNIYKFIEEVKALPSNNNIKVFEAVDDITKYLREQFAGLFKQFIINEQKNRESFYLKDIENTAKTLRDLVDYLNNQSLEKDETIKDIVKLNHPLVIKLKSDLGIPYNFYIEGKKDLMELLYARRFRYDKNDKCWKRTENEQTQLLYISSDLFDENGYLKAISASDWNDNMCRLETLSATNDDLDNLPF